MRECRTVSSAGQAFGRFAILGGVCLLTGVISGCGKEPVAASSSTMSIPAPSSEIAAKPIAELPDAKSTNAPAEKVPATDEEQVKLLIGKWTQQRTGTRNLTIRDDGTATMVVLLDSPYSFVFGDKITLDIAWELEEGRLIFETTGGTPATQIDILTKMFGDKRDQPILELSSTRLLLKDPDKGDPDQDWTRVTAEK